MTKEEFDRTYPVQLPVSVEWGDMDALEHVNNVTYFRYFENCRVDLLQRNGLWPRCKAMGISPVVTELSCRYRRPLFYPDQIIIGTRVTGIQGDRFFIEHAIFSQDQQTISTYGTGEMVFMQLDTGRRTDAPDAIRREIAELGGYKEATECL